MELFLEKRQEGANGKAKTGWTAAGIRYKGGTAPLFSSRANRAAEELILKEIIPNLTEITPEYTLGHSRFDFLCRDRQSRRQGRGQGRRQGCRHLVEVKACSLVEYGTAMFPDAPSERALKHLEELAALTAEGYICHVLFVIVHGQPESFIPNLHTDPAFAAALSRYGIAADGIADAGRAKPTDRVLIHAALLRCGEDGWAELAAPSVPVDLSHGELAAADSGNYLILLELPEAREIETGALGPLPFEAGWYVYSGSARKNLASRINRHLRKQGKQKHWHMDYLTPWAAAMKALPILSYRNLECDLARELGGLGGRAVPDFGSSDCRCGSHLYFFAAPPLKNRAFIDMLLRYRHREGLKPPP
jgi:sugar fermentation stimulation protein A